MTVGMNRLNQMFRDFKVAEDVGKMMELRRFAVEFELYGTVYWNNGQRNYLVSKNADMLCKQIRELEVRNKYPLPLQVWHENCLVPAGWEEEIEQQIKVHFCQALQKKYPAMFWEAIVAVAEGKENDNGTAVLDPIREQLDGVFREEWLQTFHGLLNLLYLRKNLSQRSFLIYSEWLQEMRQEMVDTVAEKDTFCKNFFGFAYQEKDSQIHYVVNASQQFVQKKRTDMMLMSSNIITPIFSKKCWYNYDYRLEQARKDFEREMRTLYDEKYFAILKEIAALPLAVNAVRYRDKMQQFSMEEVGNVWKLFGRQWGIVG